MMLTSGETMSLEASEALHRTKENLLSKNAATMFVLYIISTFLFIVAVQSRVAATETQGPLADKLPAPFVEPSAVAVGVPRLAAVAMSFAGLFIGCYFGVIITRLFVHGYEDIPREVYAENVLLPTIYFFLGLMVFAPLFFFGLALAILPGAFIAISLAFFTVYTSVHNDDFVDAFMHSWALSKGHRLPLFLLFGAFLLAWIVVIAVGLGVYIFVWGFSTVLAEIMLAVGGAFLLVFTLALVSAAYTSVRTYHVRKRDLDALPGGEEEAERVGVGS